MTEHQSTANVQESLTVVVGEAQSQGWIVRSPQEPADVPMVRRGEPVILLSDGNYQKVAA